MLLVGIFVCGIFVFVLFPFSFSLLFLICLLSLSFVFYNFQCIWAAGVSMLCQYDGIALHRLYSLFKMWYICVVAL